MSRKSLMTGVGFLAAAAMLLTGCGDDQAGDSNDKDGASATSTSAGGASGSGTGGSESAAPSGSGTANGAAGDPGAADGQAEVTVDEAKARQVAQDALPGGSVETLALDQKYQPNPAWDVLGTDAQGQKRRLDIDAVTGEVLKNEAATY